MSHRRNFLKQALAAGVGAAHTLYAPATLAGERASAGRGHGIGSAIRRDDTILRSDSLGDGYHMTWTAADRQAVAVNDGTGWADPRVAFYNTRLWTVEGPAPGASFGDMRGYPELDRAARPEGAPSYYGFGLLSVRGRLYQFLSTLDDAKDRPRHWTGAKLIHSEDGGRTWRNQDGSLPVVWEDWGEQNRDRFVFFGEPDGCFSLLSVLQMGQDYSANRDGHVYVYSPNGNRDGLMNQLVMARVRVEHILDRRAYEFFGGHLAGGGARWVKDIADRAPVHVFPEGWVNHTNLFPGDLVLESWLPSVVYNAALDLYMMASAGIGCAPDGTEFGKPSYLGLWVSSAPWGPWRQVYEETAWMPGGDAAARAYGPQIAPKWVAPDGMSFWLVWADLNGIREFAKDEDRLAAALEKADGPRARAGIEANFLRRYMPGFSFNAQRVDLILT
ncbi:DUF4185 domain-containing protein [Nitrospirillum pindoramense]|uniref:Uncharacterized protein DUF4185 n=1 Tax=Nitrospirillum amazonense TaxID=28077 RepID=A0A560HC91_9PROT|nr:DUF4185 domain-containing protein [Nitrospirillum amazonense]TWB43993.1 uncharacterized protein DUF4185 [Nitrospirillum amazonense]